jgi:hypothetical protein
MNAGANFYGSYPALPFQPVGVEGSLSHVDLTQICRPRPTAGQTRTEIMAAVATTAIVTMTAIRLSVTAAAGKPEVTRSVSMIMIATTASK